MFWNWTSNTQDLIEIMKRSLTTSDARPYKRSRGQSNYSKFYRRIPRTVSMSRPGQRTIVPLCVNTNHVLTADSLIGINWDCSGAWINGTLFALNGMSELVAVYDMLRVQKVEIVIVPNAIGLDYSSQTVTSGTTNIPFVYHAADFNDGAAPTATELMQNPTVSIALMDKVIRRTIYPKLEGANGVIDVSPSNRNKFLNSAAASSQRWNGFKLWVDMINTTWTYGGFRIFQKVYFECMQSK